MERRNYSKSYYFLLGIGFSSIMAGLYFIYNLKKKLNSNSNMISSIDQENSKLKSRSLIYKNIDSKIEELNSTFINNKNIMTPDMLIDLISTLKSYAEELLDTDYPNLRTKRIEGKHSQKLYESACVDFLDAIANCYEKAWSVLQKRLGLESNTLRDSWFVNKEKIDMSKFLIVKPKKDFIEFNPTTGNIKETYLHFSKKYLIDVYNLENNIKLSSFASTKAKEDFYYFRLTIIKLWNTDELYIKHKITETELMFLVAHNQLLDDKFIKIAHERINKIDLILAGFY